MRNAETDKAIFDVCVNECWRNVIIQQCALRLALHLSGVMPSVKPVVLQECGNDLKSEFS